MKAYIQEMNNITDSRELLESKPHPVIPIFIYTLIGMLLVAVIWSFFGEIDENIKAKGIVRPNEKISSIRNKVAGKVVTVNLEEGEKVNKGDVLFAIEHTIPDLQKETISSDLKKAELEKINLNKLKKSILDDVNYFSATLETETDYYNKFIKYKTDLEAQSRQVKLDTNSAGEINNTLQGLRTLKQSVQTGKNLFKENGSLYYNQYIDYSLTVKSLTDTVKQKNDVYNTSRELESTGVISAKELEDAKKQLESANLELEKYENGFMLDINTRITENEKAIKQIQINLETSKSQDGQAQKPDEILLRKYKMDTLVQLEADIAANDSNIKKLKSDLEAAVTNSQDCVVTSPIDGVINISTQINTGDLLQSGAEIATVVPEKNSVYKVQIYVSNADIANLKTGGKINYHFDALPYREYGELTGQIINIGTDARIDQDEGTSYYVVEAAIDNKPLYSYKGIRAEIKVGMTCEAQVITKTKKIMYYLLEKLF